MSEKNEVSQVELDVKAYAKLRAKQDLLALEEKEIKSRIMGAMKENEVKTIDGKYGNFTYATRTVKTINDPRVAEAEVALKTAKTQAVEDGKFTTTETDYMSYKPVKKD